MTGYPLIGERGDVRDSHLLNLPADTRVLFVQGNRDEFLRGRGIAALQSVIDKMQCTTALHVLENCGHGVPKTTNLNAMGTTQANVSGQVADAMLGFVA